MNFIYETDRLRIQILNGTYAAESLRFYEEDRELFERYESLRPVNFYTENYHRYLMNYEYNRILKGDMVRYWFFPIGEVPFSSGATDRRFILTPTSRKAESMIELKQ